MNVVEKGIELIFSFALFINALLFIPQALKIIKDKTAANVSLTTFLGFLLIQLAVVLHGIINQDYILTAGYIFSILACGTVVFLILLYKKSHSIEAVNLDEIISQIPGHVYWKDKNGVFLGSNTNNWKDFGTISLKDFIGKTDYDILDETEADKVRIIDKNVMETGETQIHEEPFTLKSGAKVLYLSVKVPLRNKNNEVVGILGTSIDITNTKQAIEERLSMLENIIALMPGHVYWKDINGVLLGCNDEQAKSAGLDSRKQITGKTDYDLPWRKQAENLRKIDAEIIRTKIPRSVEEKSTLADGKEATFISQKVPLYYNDEIIGIVGISTDITELKNTQNDLISAKQKAETANELKTKFIQNMQHDVRTPLAGVYGYMKEMAEEETDEEKKKLAQYMAASTGQLLNMCNELVDFEHIDYLGDTVELEAVDTTRFLSRVIDLNKMAAFHRGLELTLFIDPQVPAYLKLDKKKLYRALVNLIGNSLKFTDEGSVSLQVKTLNLTPETASLAFEIHDTGVGIPADKIDLVFDKFVRLNPSNAAKYKGSGLGLYYVKKFVDDMQGKLEVESIEGAGSIFRVILTLGIAQAEEVAAAAPNEIDTFDEDIVQSEMEKFPDARFNKKATAAPTAETKSESSTRENSSQSKIEVLIVEDDPILQRTIANIFKYKGCHVAGLANSVSTACESIQAQAYDLVVCDLGLPDGTGVDIIQWVKENKTHPNQQTPFVVLTANHDNTVKQQALDSGFLNVFQKPLAETDAQKMLDSYVYKKTPSVTPALGNEIIDIDASLEVLGDMTLLQEVFGMLSRSLSEDKQKLQDCYAKNDITETRKILHRLDGTFRSCVVPTLQNSRGALHDAVRSTQDLKTITALYNNFYNEVEVFLATYIKWKKDGIL